MSSSTEDSTNPTYVVLREVTAPSAPTAPSKCPSEPSATLSAQTQEDAPDPSLRIRHTKLPDGSDCFDLLRDGKLLERHMVTR